jgi:ribosome-binding protein aMBF1 (putative translation factor)
MKLGQIIRAWRNSKNLSVRPVAYEIGIPHVILHHFEHGEAIHGDNLAKILVWAFEKSEGK